MSGLSSSLWIVGSYIVAGLLFYLLLNFLTKGFIGQYIKVKMSRGRLILVKCYDVTDTYYKAGCVDSKRNLVIKDRNKKVHTFSNITPEFIGRELGMNLTEVELVKGLLVKRDFSGYSAYDLTMLDEMVNRALMLPKLNKDDNWEKAEKIILIAILLIVGVTLYLVFSKDPASITCPVVAGVNI